MNSLTFVCALVAALAMSAHGQDMNVTMTMVDVDSNSTMTSSQPDTDMPSMTNDTVTNTDTNTTITTSMPDRINMTTAAAAVTTDMPTVTDDNTTESTTPMMVMTSPTSPADPATTGETTTPSPCKQPTGRQDELYTFTGTAEFRDLAASTQIVIYEILAAAEGCKMRNFVTPETSERIFRMLGEIPLRYVYIFVNYMAMALQNEGIVGPS